MGRLSRCGYVIDEPDEQPRIDAETAIQEARVPSQFPAPEIVDQTPNRRKPEDRGAPRVPGEWS